MKSNQNNYYEYKWVKEEGFTASFSLGEGQTPFLRAGKLLSDWSGIANLWVKHEEVNPTGCFKDRESALVIAKALELGYKKVTVASSGNAAVSTAAYAQAAGIACEVFIPQKTSSAKKQLIELFGAGLHEIPGSYEDVYRYLADHPVKNAWNVTSGQNSWRTEANKGIADEIWQQMGIVPDVVVVPAGNAGCLAGIGRGFWELKQKGQIKRLPQLIAVQVKGAAPLEVATKQRQKWVNLGRVKDSVAEGIVASESYCSPKAVTILAESAGKVITVTDQEIIVALSMMIKSSLISEPTSAAAFAALKKLSDCQNKTVVVVNTGSGMKMLGEIMELIKNGVK